MFTAALLAELYQLSSSHPVGFLAQLEPGTGPIERVTNEREDITFHGNVFRSVPFFLQAYGEGTVDSPVELQAVFGNANLYMNSLKEQYWRGFVHPEWYVTLWYVDYTQPDVTPAGFNARFRVSQIILDDVAGTVRLKDDTVSTTRSVAMERYVWPRFPTMRQRR